ncbi:hypothetical protein I4U23_015413 [Adineta vaga]|nr:hypothetical protein I4U23_015413 [Adineta vaga]
MAFYSCSNNRTTISRFEQKTIFIFHFVDFYYHLTGKQGIQIAKKILANTLIAPVGISLIFSSITLLKGQTFADAKTKVKNDMPKTYLAGTCYWPFVSFINFRFVPLDYRPFLGSLAGAIWNVYLSSVANQTSESSSNSAESTSTSINQTNSRIPSELKDL